LTVITSTTVVVSAPAGLWSSPDLLRRVKQYARRPAVDTSVTDDMWYDFMTEAEVEVFSDLFSRFPQAQYSAPQLLVTTDGGYTYTFGDDADGDPVYPMGYAQIFPDLRSIPDSPLIFGEDYELEGYLLRIPGNRTRTFSAGPYARFVSRPDVAIADDVNPLLWPKEARMLLVWKALESWASRPGSGADPTYYERQYDLTLTKELTKLATAYNRSAGDSSSAGGHAGICTSRGLNVLMARTDRLLQLEDGPFNRMIDSLAPTARQEGAYQLGENVYPEDPEVGEAIVGRPGMRPMGAQLSVFPKFVQGIIQFPHNTLETTVAIAGGEIFTFDWTTRLWTKQVTTANLTTAGATLSGVPLQVGLLVVTSKLLISDGTNTPILWDGSAGAASITVLTNCPALYGQPTLHQSRVFGIKASTR
jgi:hypothetical protein